MNSNQRNMNLKVGKYYVVETFTSAGRTRVFGKLTNINAMLQNVENMRQFYRYTFEDCTVNNEEGFDNPERPDSFKVTKPVNIYSNSIESIEEVPNEALNLIYTLSEKLKTVNKYLDPETIESIVSHLHKTPKDYDFLPINRRSSTNIEGESDSESEASTGSDSLNSAESIDGGTKKQRIRVKQTKKRNKQSNCTSRALKKKRPTNKRLTKKRL